MTTHSLRPYITASRARFINTKSCLWIDGHLYNNGQRLLYVLMLSHGGKHDVGQAIYALEQDMFGLYVEKRLYTLPVNIGHETHVDHLKALNSTQRKQLRRLLVLLAMSVRASSAMQRHSTKLHCVRPRACDPFDGLPNAYGQTARAARDMLHKERRARYADRQTKKQERDNRKAWLAEQERIGIREQRARQARVNFGHDTKPVDKPE